MLNHFRVVENYGGCLNLHRKFKWVFPSGINSDLLEYIYINIIKI